MNAEEQEDFLRRCDCLGDRFRLLLHARDKPDGITPDLIFKVEYPKGEFHYVTYNTTFYGTWRWPYIIEEQARRNAKKSKLKKKGKLSND